MDNYDDRFCFYCQHEYRSIERLIEHIEKEHKNTTAYYNIAIPYRRKQKKADK